LELIYYGILTILFQKVRNQAEIILLDIFWISLLWREHTQLDYYYYYFTAFF